MFIITDEEWNQGAKIEEYNGVWGVVSARKSNDGVVYTQWCKPRTGRDEYASKDVPMGIKLGNIDKAREVLGEFLNYLDAVVGKARGGAPRVDDDTIPF